MSQHRIKRSLTRKTPRTQFLHSRANPNALTGLLRNLHPAAKRGMSLVGSGEVDKVINDSVDKWLLQGSLQFQSRVNKIFGVSRSI